MFKMFLRTILTKNQLKLVKDHPSDPYVNISFSQEGEDLLLLRLLGNKPNGFYVDIGAHHPFRFSNTYKFYQMGWRGINIEPFPGSMQLFEKHRPDDINLEIAILNDDSKEMVYYVFDEQAHNTFDEQSALKVHETAAPIKMQIPIKPYRLCNILDKYLPKGQAIDFFSIDVEGMDKEVLMSNNWEKYRPKYIVAENKTIGLKEDFNSGLSIFLAENDYELIARAVNSVVYKLITF